VVTSATEREPTGSGTPDAVPVTVVIPLYQMGHAIERTIASALAQTHPPTDVIVVDDGSTDDGPARVRATFGDAVRLLHQANAGAGPARNHGAQAARTRWIAYLDADDLWLPDHLEALAAAVRAFPDHRVFASRSRSVPERDVVAGRVPDEVEQARAAGADRPPRVIDYFAEAVAKQRPFFPTTLLIDRALLLEAGGFDGRYRRGQDMELMARVALAHPMVGTDRITAWYVRGPDPIQPSPRRPSIQRLDDVNSHLEAIEAQANALGAEAGASRAAYVTWRLRKTVARWAHAGDRSGVLQLLRVAPPRLKLRLSRFAVLAALPKPLRTSRFD
jgi:glycosyltransferase involved in cell wall biosynthesis